VCVCVWGGGSNVNRFGGAPEGRRKIVTFRCKCEDNIKTDHIEIQWKGVDWINPTSGRDDGMFMWTR
jgi:hypothetical protein